MLMYMDVFMYFSRFSLGVSVYVGYAEDAFALPDRVLAVQLSDLARGTMHRSAVESGVPLSDHLTFPRYHFVHFQLVSLCLIRVCLFACVFSSACVNPTVPSTSSF
jgi:hypothetical protein